MKEIKINTLIWSKENLDVEYYSNGDKILYASNEEEWRDYSVNESGCWCYYKYDKQNERYGKMYNFYAVSDKRGLAPIGWRVPTDKDWDNLVDSLGGSFIAGKLLKGKEFYKENDTEILTNNSLNVLPSGYHSEKGSQLLGFNAHFWTATEYLEDYAWLRFLTSQNNFVGRSFDYKSSGFPIRLVKDVKNFTKIGEQEWSTFNIDTTIFMNGDNIPIAKNLEDLIYFSKNKLPCCCSFNFDDSLVGKYGRLYNWYALNDSRGLFDSDLYHIPSDSEWTELVNFCGGEKEAGKVLKSSNGDWGKNSKDKFNFSAEPGGYFGEGYFALLNYTAVFWSSTEYMNEYAWLRFISYDSDNFDRGFDYKNGGYSIRLLKNK